MTPRPKRRALILIVLSLLVLLAIARVAGSRHEIEEVEPYPLKDVEQKSLAGFEEVFIFGDGSLPPVLLLHELPGLSPQSLWFADELAEHFTVYVPLLFGKPNSNKEKLRALWDYAFSKRWKFSGEAETSRPIVGAIKDLVRELRERHPGQPIGAIGMCLTGSFPVALAGDEAVKAIVLAQPSLPLLNWGRNSRRRSLGVSTPELTRATQRVLDDELRVLGVRFEHDKTSKPEKWLHLNEMWGERFLDREVCDGEYRAHHILKKAHSVLTGEWHPGLQPDHPVMVRRREVIEFLRDASFGEGVVASDCASKSSR